MHMPRNGNPLKEEPMMSEIREIKILTVTLNNGVQIRQLGFGVF